MDFKELIKNYNEYEKAYIELNKIKKFIKRYNKTKLYNTFEIMFYFITSFFILYYSFNWSEEPISLFFFLPFLGFIVCCFCLISCEFFNFFRLRKNKNINKITKILFKDTLYQNYNKFIKFNNKVNNLPEKKQDYIVKIRETIINIIKYNDKEFQNRFPKEKHNYNKEEYEKAAAECKKRIEMLDILIHFLKQEDIQNIRKFNKELQEIIITFDTFKQKELLDVIDQKIKEEEMNNKNENQIKKENISILEKLNNRNNKLIKEI